MSLWFSLNTWTLPWIGCLSVLLFINKINVRNAHCVIYLERYIIILMRFYDRIILFSRRILLKTYTRQVIYSKKKEKLTVYLQQRSCKVFNTFKLSIWEMFWTLYWTHLYWKIKYVYENAFKFLKELFVTFQVVF
jgi:hypothetical protein